MKVKDVIIRALGFAGRDDVASMLARGEELSGEAAEIVETLLYCYNAVEDELARFYFILTAEETLKNFRGVYEFASFSHSPLKIISVEKDGKKISYEKTLSSLKTAETEITVKYRYAPEKKILSDECGFSEEAISQKMLAAGAASEYFLIQGDMKQAEFYEEMYRREIDTARRLALKTADFPPRSWV